MMAPLAWAVGSAVVGTLITWVGSAQLDGAADQLSRHLGLPRAVHGAVVVAVGSSFPELASVLVSAIRYDTFQLGVSAVVGSAVFNVLVIPATSTLAADRGLETNRTLVYREAQFYLVAIAALLGTFAVATIYSPASPGSTDGVVSRPLALAPLGLYGLYLFVQYTDASARRVEPTPAEGGFGRQAVRFGVGLVGILVGVELLVGAAVAFGDLLGTPSFLWGATVVAAGTSLPDALISARAARAEDSTTSLANVLGSNVFDLLAAIPLGVVVAGRAVVDFRVAAPLLGALAAVTVALFLAMRTDFRLSRREAAALLGCYAAFVGWLGLEIVGAVGLLPV